MDKLKIGIVLNYKRAEQKKDELLSIDLPDKPWLKLADDKKYLRHVVLKKNKKFLTKQSTIIIYPWNIMIHFHYSTLTFRTLVCVSNSNNETFLTYFKLQFMVFI